MWTPNFNTYGLIIILAVIAYWVWPIVRKIHIGYSRLNSQPLNPHHINEFPSFKEYQRKHPFRDAADYLVDKLYWELANGRLDSKFIANLKKNIRQESRHQEATRTQRTTIKWPF